LRYYCPVPECLEVGVLRDASTNTEITRRPTWKKKVILQALKINNESGKEIDLGKGQPEHSRKRASTARKR
jgi:hypothetical protein